MRRTRLIQAILAVIILGLTTFVVPFSYLPNPVGIYYQFMGGYHYDPNSLLQNGFARLGDNSGPMITSRLGDFIGDTGLDPFDPNMPLRGYRLLSAQNRPNLGEVGAAEVELEYADGSKRIYTIPVFYREFDPLIPAGQPFTGLDRLYSPHLELSYTKLARRGSPIRVSQPQRLPLPDAAHELSEGGWSGNPYAPDIIWAPDSTAFLIRARGKHRDEALWRVTLDGAAPRRVAGNVASYAWSADGRQIIYLTSAATNDAPVERYTITVADWNGENRRDIGASDSNQVTVIGTDVYALAGGALWRRPLDGSAAQQLGMLPDLDLGVAAPDALAVSPDTQRVAYRCGGNVCVADVTGANIARVDLGYPIPQQILRRAPAASGLAPTAPTLSSSPAQIASIELAWSPDGSRLAVVAGAAPQGHSRERPPELWLVGRDGQTQRSIVLGPDGPTRAPQWTTEGRFIIVNTFPIGGRRIIAVDSNSSDAWDLSEPRWDTFAMLMPDGKQLLLWNGRGGFWKAELQNE
jgi:hypothetical protein